MNHTKQAVLDTCVAGLAGQQVLEQTMEHMKENWPDVRRARVALRQLDAVAKCMEKQATTMACKIGMSMALKHRKKMQCQQPAAVAQTPLRQVTNFIADSSSASSTKKRAVCKSQSRIDRDVAPSMLQFTSPRVLRPRPVLEKPRPDAGKMYTARTAVKYMHQRSQNDKKWRKCNVAAELVRDRLVPVHRDNLLNRYNLFAESIQKGCQVEAALDQVRPFHDRGRPLLVDKQECIEFARSMAHHDRAISEGDVASFLTNARKRKAEKAGKDASMCRQVCPKTVHGYLQVFEDMPGEIKVHGSVQEKPLRRLVAEQSLMSSVTFVTTVAASHFIPVADAAAADVPPADNVLARKMQEYMDKNGGGYFRCVLPNLVLNLDATTLLVHTRKTKTGKEWYASSVDDTGKRRSIFTPGTSSPDCPQWLTLIKGISGAGCTLRWAIVMKGIPESELPGDKVADGVHVVPVAGWGLGSGVNRDVAGEGYVIFVRGDQEGCLKIVYEWYMERIVLHASYAMDTMLDDDCLLASDASCFVEASGVKSMLCGAYIIWDEIRRKPIRVGKACSDTGSFGARMTGHMEALKSSRCDSEFYTCYPRKDYVNPTYASKARGFFETLKQFIGVGFRKEKTRLLCTDTTHGGILEWPPFAVELSKKMSSATSEAKRAELTAYMFECVYGLMLAPRENMSQSMGFEPLLLVQNKRYLDNVA